MSLNGPRNRRIPQMTADTAPSWSRDAYRLADTTKRLLNCFYAVYDELGGGFLEAPYSNALAIALTQDGVPFKRELLIPIFFRGVVVGTYRADFLLANEIIIELKAARRIDPTHVAQVVNYLRASTIELGYILNFGSRPSYKRLILSNERKAALRSSAVICGSSGPGAPNDARPS
jgi:GxxExxY protein